MTQILVVNDWFANRLIQKTIQTFTIEDIEFEIMALTQSMINAVKSCESHKEMLFLAADNGLSFNRSRVIDDKELTINDIAALWGEELKDIDSDPCIRARVGEKVCEISGLAEMLEDMLSLEAEVAEEEEAARYLNAGLGVIDGDNLSADGVVIDNMNQESLDAEDTVIYAN